MTTHQERIERFEKRDRTVKLARTYLRKARDWMWASRSDNDEIVQPLLSYRDLLEEMFDVAEDIIKELPDDYFDEHTIGDPLGLGTIFGIAGDEKYNPSDDALVGLNKVVAAMEQRRAAGIRRRLIEKLENVEGRTPEEAALYAAKAKQLRGE